ncbi:MBL fold metallo-hydrolase [Brevibacillus sp. TJ4]|uniref:MBL fold metallo-hydrolase n=1 Tax=Brevibacillus sp. TJ4 TaxID=3234853 RepID=UPI0037D62D61
MFQVEVWGGAGEHGRSCYHVQFGQRSVLLDCGVKKGQKKEETYPKLDADKVRMLTTVFLSHAHEDHSMAIPLLYRHGYTGVVWTTRSTVRQLANYYAKWQQYVQDAGDELPYTSEHMEQVRYRFVEDMAPPGQWFTVEPGMQACWGPSGHLAGSIWLLLCVDGQTLFYSGDYCQDSRLLAANLPDLRYVRDLQVGILDAAYADDEATQEQLVDDLVSACKQVLERGGHVWLPVPIYGRGHEIIDVLAEALPGTEIVCDTGLEVSFQAMLEEEQWFKTEELHLYKQRWSSRVQVLTREQLLHKSTSLKKAIFVTSDPMLQSKASAKLVEAFATSPNNALIMTGHVYPGTLAARLLAAEQSVPRVLHYRYKVHQGLPDVARMLDGLKPKFSLLVHAPKAKTDRLKAKLTARGYDHVYSCAPGDQLVFCGRTLGTATSND